MRCPYCASEESKVVDSRESEAGDAIRRRRECLGCERRYTTYERIEEAPLLVEKRDGREEVFSRQKLLNGLLRATEKRGIPLERLQRAVDDIENDLRRGGGQRVTTQMVGEGALRQLREIDKVAYIRFASVYRQFGDIDEFQQELARLESIGVGAAPRGKQEFGAGADGDGPIATGIIRPSEGPAVRGGRGA
jgi:transcriptional repressor NrdR